MPVYIVVQLDNALCEQRYTMDDPHELTGTQEKVHSLEESDCIVFVILSTSSL